MTDPMVDWIDYICCSNYTSLIEAIELYIQGKSQRPTAPSTLKDIKFLSLSNEPTISDTELMDASIHPSSTPKKKVQFSENIDVRTHQAYDAADANKLFYTELDYLSMHLANVRAIKQTRMISLTKSFDELDQQPPKLDDVSTTGLENLLICGMAEATEADLKQCRHAVIKESMRQLQLGEYDPEKIACVSRYYSIWAAKRAHEIGVYRLEQVTN